MDKQLGDFSAAVRVLGFDEEQHFGIDSNAIGWCVAVAFAICLFADATSILQRRRAAGRRIQLRSSKHAINNKGATIS